MFEPLGFDPPTGAGSAVISRFGRARYGQKEYRVNDPVRFKVGGVYVFGKLVRFELAGRHEGTEVAAATGRYTASAVEVAAAGHMSAAELGRYLAFGVCSCRRTHLAHICTVACCQWEYTRNRTVNKRMPYRKTAYSAPSKACAGFACAGFACVAQVRVPSVSAGAFRGRRAARA